MNKILFSSICFIFAISCTITSCSERKQDSSNINTETVTYNTPEEELRAIMEGNGWEEISNSTKVYRLDYGKTKSWYTAAIYCKNIGGNVKYVIARTTGDRLDNGALKYKTLPIIECDYTDYYDRTFNGYISDGGSTAYLNF